MASDSAAALPPPADWCESKHTKRVFIQKSKTSPQDTLDITSKDAVYSLTREMVKCFFDLPSVDAARILKICLTVLKKIRTWVGVSRWPYNCIRVGEFEMSRREVVDLRKSIIQRLETGESLIYPGVLPFLREAERLSVAFLSISSPTVYALEARAASMALKERMSAALKPRPVGSVMAARVVTEVFKKPVLKKRERWVSSGAMCLSDSDAVVLSEKVGGAGKAAKDEEASAPICPLTFVNECSKSAWLEPMYPPTSEIVDGVDAFWPVMEDPRRIWMQELIVRSLLPSQSGPGISVADLLASEPVSAAEMQFVNGLLSSDHDD